MAWVTSEQMLLHYLNSFRKAFWTHSGSPKTKASPDTGEETKQRIAAETREALAANIPDVLVNLVGQQAAAAGTNKVFETLQNVTLNKQLFYSLLETAVEEVFPELPAGAAAGDRKAYAM